MARMGNKVLMFLLLALMVAAVAFALVGWYAVATDEPLTGHVRIALVLGIILSLVVGVGLMGLVFYSSRKGYDERASEDHRRSSTRMR